MKITKKLQNIANESLEIYHNQEFLTELLNKVKPKAVTTKPIRMRYAISLSALFLAIIIATPIIVSNVKLPDQTQASTSTSEITSGENWYIGSDAPDISFKSYIAIDKPEYDIDNVELTISYGDLFPAGVEEELKGRWNIPQFDVYLFVKHYTIVDGIRKLGEEKKVLYRTVNENYVSEEYLVKSVKVGGKYKYEFNHSEKVIFPQEFFTESEGIIGYRVCGTDILTGDYKSLNVDAVSYKKESGKIIIS
ncbi:MAG: hypothetical protein IJF75_06915 [Clostridia bacterium]|nr:hypothetical protein [Clostridia bacterium]